MKKEFYYRRQTQICYNDSNYKELRNLRSIVRKEINKELDPRYKVLDFDKFESPDPETEYAIDGVNKSFGKVDLESIPLYPRIYWHYIDSAYFINSIGYSIISNYRIVSDRELIYYPRESETGNGIITIGLSDIWSNRFERVRKLFPELIIYGLYSLL